MVPVTPLRRRAIVGTAAYHFWRLAWWKKALLIFALLIGVVGVVGAVAGAVRGTPPEVRTSQAKVEDLQKAGPRSSLTAEQQTELKTAEDNVNAYRHWFYDKTAPQLWRIGLGFFVAFVLGFAARQFVKTMATLAALLVVGVGVAIYFGYLDSGGVRANVTTGTGWVMDRLGSMKETVLSFIGASLSGTVGFVIGFTRSKK